MPYQMFPVRRRSKTEAIETSRQSSPVILPSRPTLRPQPKTATRSGAAQVDWIIDLVAGLESPPLPLRTSLQLDSFPTSCTPSFLSRIVSFPPPNCTSWTNYTAIIFEQESCSFDSLDQPHSQSLSSPFITESPPNLDLLRLCDITHLRRL